MSLKVLLLLAFATVALTDRVSYENYKVYQIIPKDMFEVKVIERFKNDKNFDFWRRTRHVGRPVEVMVNPEAQETFTRYLSRRNIDYSVLIDNVERTITTERFLNEFNKKRKNPNARISFDSYYSFDEINEYLAELVETYSNTELHDIGTTTEGRTLRLLHIRGSGSATKPAILVDGGIHAREWIAPAVVLYIIQQLLETSDNSDLLENLDWYIIPVLNPDGYEYSINSDRLWRKTRSAGSRCYGADANRNFDFHWLEVGASDYECDETYAGQVAFSEPETQALRDFSLAAANYTKLYLTFHSYGEYILYPWGYTSAYPSDADELQSLGDAVNDAIIAASTRGSDYLVGSSTNALYAAAGGSDDWNKGVAGIQLSYTVELPGGGRYGFDLPASEISGVVRETFEGVKVFANYVKNKFA